MTGGAESKRNEMAKRDTKVENAGECRAERKNGTKDGWIICRLKKRQIKREAVQMEQRRRDSVQRRCRAFALGSGKCTGEC